jgi:hypothetical protein
VDEILIEFRNFPKRHGDVPDTFRITQLGKYFVEEALCGLKFAHGTWFPKKTGALRRLFQTK